MLHFRCAPAPLLLAFVVGWTEANIPSGNVLIPAQDEADAPNLLPEVKILPRVITPTNVSEIRYLEIIIAMPMFHYFKHSVTPCRILLAR